MKYGLILNILSNSITSSIISSEKLNLWGSPDGSKYPFMPGFGIKDTAYSGTTSVEKTNFLLQMNYKLLLNNRWQIKVFSLPFFGEFKY
jgi:hypothetical protein